MKRIFQLFILACLISIGVFAALPRTSANTTTNKPIDFNRDVRPILSDNCFTCHGPDDKKRMAELRLDTKEGVFASGGVIVSGNAAKSRLYQRISATDLMMRMPPVDSGHKLTDAQIEIIRRWIDEGAKWEMHWAYVVPKRPEIPTVKNRRWVRNPIDNFILSRLEKEGLKPSIEADKITLLRRLHLDLTGLPPTLEDIDKFLADQSSNAYEKVVDQLLASEHFGERMALPWLDLARYADTHGYHIDSHRDMWVWRDWVIRSFNENKPFDQFTIEQLAGDLLPNATTEQKIASGFNRNHMINFEGGAIPEEYQTEYVVDRVETTANTWMAMTLGCARCHSHKYDPITQKEFYQFFAFFNSVNEKGLDGQTGNAMPILPLPSDEQKAQLDKLNNEIKFRENTLTDEKIKPLQVEWEKAFRTTKMASLKQGLVAHYNLENNYLDATGNQPEARKIRGDPNFSNGIIGKSLSFDGDSEVSLINPEKFNTQQPFNLSFWIRPSGNRLTHIVQKLESAGSRKGIEIALDDFALIGIQHWAGKIVVTLSSSANSAIQIRSTSRLPMNSWQHLSINFDGKNSANGLKLFINGKPENLDIIQDNLSGTFQNEAPFLIGNKELGKPYRGQLDDWRIYQRLLNESEIPQLARDYPIQQSLLRIFTKPAKEESQRIRDYFLTYIAPDTLRKTFAELTDLKKQREALNKQINTIMVMSEMEKPRETFILGRGDYRNKTEKVRPGVPSILPPLPGWTVRNRLTLARWLVAPSNPLTARVTVNRFWQMIFGQGIVKTAEDFGSQGEPPVHPELLDWLANEFIQSGWNVKAMMRMLATSATYRQSSRVTPELIEKDPENRLLARGARFRLPAEFVRDNALSVSGLLNQSVGGSSVFPYQSPGLWEEMAFGDGFSAQEYKQSHGKDLYRRSMYTFWKRTVPPASLATFDAPDREKCTARRSVTNTPLQALVLMNDPTYIEAARKLAERILSEGGVTTQSRIGFAFRLATSRKPSVNELQILNRLLDEQLQIYKNNKGLTESLLKIGESAIAIKVEPEVLAAWTMVASAVLNLDETITKE
ncbi:MAG: DUF1553 domain-containing protein [Acidobacteriota bacterium]